MERHDRFIQEDVHDPYFTKEKHPDPIVDPLTGRLLGLSMIVMEAHQFRLRMAMKDDVQWIADTLTRVGRLLGTRVEPGKDASMVVEWGS